ncbi:MAG: amidase family protein [Burkholderiaceae bacterium]
MNEIWREPAVVVAELIRDQKISAHEVTTQALQRIDNINGRINAIVDYKPELALAAADAIDRRIAKDEDVGALGGVPVTIKVIIDQEGFATTNGVRLQRNAIATHDSPAVTNLRNAGAVLLGRTNTPAFSYRWFTNNSLHGATLNPHNAALTPGGRRAEQRTARLQANYRPQLREGRQLP